MSLAISNSQRLGGERKRCAKKCEERDVQYMTNVFGADIHKEREEEKKTERDSKT